MYLISHEGKTYEIATADVAVDFLTGKTEWRISGFVQGGEQRVAYPHEVAPIYRALGIWPATTREVAGHA